MADGDGAAGTAVAEATEGAEASQDATQQQAPAGPAPEQSGGVDTAAWPEEARAAYQRERERNAELQRERGDERIAAKNAAREEGKADVLKTLAPALAGILGIKLPDDGKGAPSAEELAQQLSASTSQTETLTGERDAALRESAAIIEAWKAGADPDKLDYLRFRLSRRADYAASDASTDEGRATVKASIEALLAEDATLRRSVAVGASGVEKIGGAGSDEITPEAFAHMSLQDRQVLYTNDRVTYDRLVSEAAATRK